MDAMPPYGNESRGPVGHCERVSWPSSLSGLQPRPLAGWVPYQRAATTIPGTTVKANVPTTLMRRGALREHSSRAELAMLKQLRAVGWESDPASGHSARANPRRPV
jgi:hypothetical protein